MSFSLDPNGFVVPVGGKNVDVLVPIGGKSVDAVVLMEGDIIFVSAISEE